MFHKIEAATADAEDATTRFTVLLTGTLAQKQDGPEDALSLAKAAVQAKEDAARADKDAAVVWCYPIRLI